jgi:bifunctional DNA-binding transcriptional regulator/antitoxin component of YhaV-PrlF toxin-antitoxin module
LVLGKIEQSAEIVFTSYVRNEGRITVPKELRDGYGIRVGDLVECKIRKIK